jgi:hypothetical protein
MHQVAGVWPKQANTLMSGRGLWPYRNPACVNLYSGVHHGNRRFFFFASIRVFIFAFFIFVLLFACFVRVLRPVLHGIFFNADRTAAGLVLALAVRASGDTARTSRSEPRATPSPLNAASQSNHPHRPSRPASGYHRRAGQPSGGQRVDLEPSQSSARVRSGCQPGLRGAYGDIRPHGRCLRGT